MLPKSPVKVILASAFAAFALLRFLRNQGALSRLRDGKKLLEAELRIERQKTLQLQNAQASWKTEKDALEKKVLGLQHDLKALEEVHKQTRALPVQTIVEVVHSNGTLLNKPVPKFHMSGVKNGEFVTVTEADFAGKFSIVLFYPADHNPTAATQLCYFIDDAKYFESAYCEIYACSADSEYSHLAWANTPRENGGLGSSRITLLSDKTQKAIPAFGIEDPQNPGRSLYGLYIVDIEGIVRYIFSGTNDFGVKSDAVLRRVRELSGVKDSLQEESLVVDWASGRHSFVEVSSWNDVGSSSPPQSSISPETETESNDLLASTVTTLDGSRDPDARDEAAPQSVPEPAKEEDKPQAQQASQVTQAAPAPEVQKPADPVESAPEKKAKGKKSRK